MELYVIEMEFENVHFTLVFTVFYGFVSIHRSIESVGCCADKLRVCPRRKTIFQSSFDMDKNPCFIFSIGTMVSGFFLMFCARDKNVIIYWRTMGEMTFALFSNFTSRAVF